MAYHFKWSPREIWGIEIWPYNELEFWNQRMVEISEKEKSSIPE